MLDFVSGPAEQGAELVYADDGEPGITRRRAGKAFAYYDPSHKLIRDPEILARIRALAIPPAYTDVWINADASGHIQATGRDARGRKQYRYHQRWSANAQEEKFRRMLDFAAALPALRARVEEDLQRRRLDREKILATIVRLLEATLIRIGNDDYARANHSYGLTTLRDRHVAIHGAQLRFEFKGKSGKAWRLSFVDRRIANVLRKCQELNGQHLFRYRDEAGEAASVSSTDVNAYLRTISGLAISAKDFRTWAGTALAAEALARLPPFENQTQAKKLLRAAIVEVAARLGNTAAVCRKSYVHPDVIDAFLAGELSLGRFDQVEAEAESALLALREKKLLAFLRRRARAAAR